MTLDNSHYCSDIIESATECLLACPFQLYLNSMTTKPNRDNEQQGSHEHVFGTDGQYLLKNQKNCYYIWILVI